MGGTVYLKGRGVSNVAARKSLPMESAFLCDCKGPASQRLGGETSQAQGTTGTKALRQKCVQCWSSRVECGKQTGEAGSLASPLVVWEDWRGTQTSDQAHQTPSLLLCGIAVVSAETWAEEHHPKMVVKATAKGCREESGPEKGELARSQGWHLGRP